MRGDSEQSLAVRVLARAHQTQIAARQRQANQLRNALREFDPAALEILGTDLDSKMAVALLSVAPTPAAGRKLSKAQDPVGSLEGRARAQPRREGGGHSAAAT